jgi:hypothetical protein
LDGGEGLERRRRESRSRLLCLAEKLFGFAYAIGFVGLL